MAGVSSASDKSIVGELEVSGIGFFFFSSRRRHTRFDCDWSSDVCSSDLLLEGLTVDIAGREGGQRDVDGGADSSTLPDLARHALERIEGGLVEGDVEDVGKIGRASCRERV